MTFRTLMNFTAFGISALVALPGFSAPVLRSNIEVTAAIITVGDMFTDAGINAERALFRAPAPGTAGAVSIEAIRVAAEKVGILNFEHPEIYRVRVERAGIPVDEPMLKNLIIDDLQQKGIVSGGVIAQAHFDTIFSTTYSDITDLPVRLANLRYTPGSGIFSARFAISGHKQPIDLQGRLDLMIEAPHLASPLPGGTILSASDIEMRPILLRYAETGGLATIEQLVGKELRRPGRNGVLIRPSDVNVPKVIKRSEMVTIYYRKGGLTLSVKGQALSAAERGKSVAVLNLASKKVIHGIAVGFGVVEMAGSSSHISDIES